VTSILVLCICIRRSDSKNYNTTKQHHYEQPRAPPAAARSAPPAAPAPPARDKIVRGVNTRSRCTGKHLCARRVIRTSPAPSCARRPSAYTHTRVVCHSSLSCVFTYRDCPYKREWGHNDKRPASKPAVASAACCCCLPPACGGGDEIKGLASTFGMDPCQMIELGVNVV
jgi:hypothetical protein